MSEWVNEKKHSVGMRRLVEKNVIDMIAKFVEIKALDYEILFKNFKLSNNYALFWTG